MNYAPYSASKISIFDECPYKFKLQYVDRVKVPFVEKAFFEKGKFFHYAFQFYPNDVPKPFNFRLSSKSEIKEYVNILNDFLRNKEIRNLLLTEDENEREISFSFRKSNRVLFKGIIDYLSFRDDVAVIVDWKSGKNWNKILGKTDIQIPLYALWVLENYSNINRIDASYFYVEENDRDKTTFTREKLPELKDTFDNKINMIETEKEWCKTPHSFCKYCDYLNICKQ